MLDRHEEAVLGVELVEVSELEELLVVVESASARDLLVGRIYLGDDDVHEHSRNDESHAPEEEEATPLVTEVGEADSPHSPFQEHLEAGVERATRLGLLGEESEERAGGEEEDEGTEEEPGQETEGVDLDELGEGPEDAGGLEGEVEAKGNGDHYEAREVGLGDGRGSELLEVVHVA